MINSEVIKEGKPFVIVASFVIVAEYAFKQFDKK